MTTPIANPDTNSDWPAQLTKLQQEIRSHMALVNRPLSLPNNDDLPIDSQRKIQEHLAKQQIRHFWEWHIVLGIILILDWVLWILFDEFLMP